MRHFIKHCFLVDDPHPAAAKPFDNAVVRDRLPDHWDEILGLVVRQVNGGEEVGDISQDQLVKHLVAVEKVAHRNDPLRRRSLPQSLLLSSAKRRFPQ